MPLPMLGTDTTVTDTVMDTTVWDTVDTTDTPIEVIMADTGNAKLRLNPLLPPTPKLMLPLMLTTDTTVTVWDTVDTMVDITDTPMVDTDIVTGKEMLKPKLNPKLMPLPMPGTDITDILTDTEDITVWDTVDITDTPTDTVITADGGNLFYTMSRLLTKWK